MASRRLPVSRTKLAVLSSKGIRRFAYSISGCHPLESRAFHQDIAKIILIHILPTVRTAEFSLSGFLQKTWCEYRSKLDQCKFHFIPLRSICPERLPDGDNSSFNGNIGLSLLPSSQCSQIMEQTGIDRMQIESLKRAVRERFGRTLDSSADYDRLSLDIQEVTGEPVSPTTLKRLYGYVRPATIPRTSTLSVLSRYAGYAGWSDFCEKQGKIHAADVPENASSGSKASRRKTGVYVSVAAVAVIAAALAFFPWDSGDGSTDRHPAGKDTLVVISEADTLIVSLKDSLQMKYDAVLDECISFADRQCDEVWKHYGDMDIIEYYAFVQSEYQRIVFSDIDGLVEKRTAEEFPDKGIREKYRFGIFAACRDYCMQKLLREFPQDELKEAARRQ